MPKKIKSSQNDLVGKYFITHPKSTVDKNKKNSDKKSVEELNELFNYNGDFSDIEVWLKHENFRLRKKNEDAEREMRIDNATKSFWFSAIWALFIAFIIIMHACCPGFVLTHIEFMFIIGSLTASILTYYLLVIKYLFYRGNDNNTDTKQ